MASPALLSWIQTTVLIENDWGETGTGFFVLRMVDTQKARAFLVTNKHVLNKDASLRTQAKEVFINVNMMEGGDVVPKRGVLPLAYEDGSRRWREHSDPDVDVLAFDVTALITSFPNVQRKMADYSTFANEAKLAEHDIAIGDDVLAIGYPIGLRQGKTNHPIVRSGTIATQIGIPFQDFVEENGHQRPRTVRGFLVDGATVPGSSGSPVILKPVSGRYVKDRIVMQPAPALLLGIISETYYAPIQAPKWSISSFAGLGLALDAKTIEETIELFFAAPPAA